MKEQENMSISEKLNILADAAKYDVSCSSSGVERRGDGRGIGNSSRAGICHSFGADGRCISLLKILFTNECIFDCKYCMNRKSNDVRRACFTPEEVCNLTIQFYRRNYIEGLFLSSGIINNPTYTMEQLYRTVYLLRTRYYFQGYIHVKAIPGADAQIVEVRVMYDGMCSIMLLPYGYPSELEKYGIKAKMFAPIRPFLSTNQNNRDHRKIVVIDGKVAFTGGVNLADEYINEKEVYGYWKDTAVKITGEAVRSFTVMYLQMWHVSENGAADEYEKYLQNIVFDKPLKDDGFVIPYGEMPTVPTEVAKTVYESLFNTAKKYVHVMTPYFIVEQEFFDTMRYAAQRGVEVKMILPHIPDKKIVYYIARNYYPKLLEAGIQVYEYTPGFVHAKVFSVDGSSATVGTINLDYRSFYHHFECGCYFYDSSVIQNIEADFQRTLEDCQEVTMEYYKKLPLYQKLIGTLFKLIAPLM